MNKELEKKKFNSKIILISVMALVVLVCTVCALLYFGVLHINNPSNKRYPVRGVDVSHYQGDIDWNQLSSENISFVVSSYSSALIIASGKDIFFPAGRVFNKAGKIFAGPVTMVEIDSKHLPSDETMIDVCKRTIEFFENT